MSYRVVKKGRIESVTGKTPRCRHCGKRLRPSYKNQVELITKRYLFTEKPEGPAVEFDPIRGKWRQTVTVRKLVGRKFLGTFGKYGDGYFCNHVCARAWAIATVQKIEAGTAELVERCPDALPSQHSAKTQSP